MIDIGEVTTWLLDELGMKLVQVNTLIGDGVAPEAGGWPEGSPNTSAPFKPYCVLRYAGGTPAPYNDVPLCSTYGVRFYVSYTLAAYENDRGHADDLSAYARGLLKDLGVVEVQCGDLVVSPQRVFLDSMQGATRDDSVFPKMWSASTNFRIDVARAP